MKVKAKEPWNFGNFNLAAGKYADVPESIATEPIADGILVEVKDDEFRKHLEAGQKAAADARLVKAKQAEESRNKVREMRSPKKEDD